MTEPSAILHKRAHPTQLLRASLELLLLLEPAAAWRAGGSRGASGKGSESGPQELGRGRDRGIDLLASLGFARREQVRLRAQRPQGKPKAKPFFIYNYREPNSFGTPLPLCLLSVFGLPAVKGKSYRIALQPLTALLFNNIGLKYLLSVV